MEQVVAFTGAQELAVPYLVYPVSLRLPGHYDGGGNHRAGQSATAGFIDAGDVVIALCRKPSFFGEGRYKGTFYLSPPPYEISEDSIIPPPETASPW